jgi:regulator of sigma D
LALGVESECKLTVKAFIRVSNKSIDKANIRFRLTDGRRKQLFHKSDIVVNPALWDGKKECYKAKCVIDPIERTALYNAVSDRKQVILNIYDDSDNAAIDKDEFEKLIDKAIHPDKYKEIKKSETFFDSFDIFLEKQKMTDERKEGYRVIKRIFQRYEMFVSLYERHMNSLKDLEDRYAELDIEAGKYNRPEFDRVYTVISELVKDRTDVGDRGNLAYPLVTGGVIDEALKEAGFADDEAFVSDFKKYREIEQQAREIQHQAFSLPEHPANKILQASTPQQQPDCWRFYTPRIVVPSHMRGIMDNILATNLNPT